MKQLRLPGIVPPEHIVNVASVRQLSPFRYPGGKTWLVPTVRQWLLSLPAERRKEFVEPFAGGAIVGLSVAFEQLATHVTLVELDEQVAAVWQAIISENLGEWLADQIIDLNFSSEIVEALLKKRPASVGEHALQTIVRNRINRGGIMAPGAGRVKYGEKGRGIASRWYPKTLARRIRDISAVRERLSFIHGDGLDFLSQHALRQDMVFFIDPPYTASSNGPGKRLYTYSSIDHERLFELASKLAGEFLMTYNFDEPIVEMAEKYHLDWHITVMKNTHHTHKREMIIGRDLAWLR
ncbi:MAG: DNA adenine methylase [Anaerolineae bacterium]